MADMSRAIRTTIEQRASTLQGLDDDTLHDFAQIVAAFAADLYDEVAARALVRAGATELK